MARELETGTFRLVWTQTVTRQRWLATKLGLTVLAVAAVIGILSLAVTWWAQPLDGAMGSQRGCLASRMTPIAFGMRGVVPVGYGVFALVLGTFVGLWTEPGMYLAMSGLLTAGTSWWLRRRLS